ncbi:MarR family winged helix-turn-helix transcriptional regulator [Streptomyces sp. TLI_105]|uniref:MarR family winged helix-turn-helix transcriptional regulator n=1 Tax=Streptomyces sp. TLI_105 TaxID=1881019 RepID=UPI000899CB10|nr:MarR family winged helix-turn-helix transcriptional regulator [Streptomyces sp. TLI_105]SED49230.1 DNA-binding transcriptional regulator, MarR family [Streptomyces sp. TLI_105]
MERKPKPIGFLLNRTDEALTRVMDGTLGEFGLTRLAWQVLNVVKDGDGTTDTEVLSVLSANADAPALTAAIDTTVAGGWVSRPAPGRLALTLDGTHRLAEVGTRVAAFRTRSVEGISPEEYGIAVRVLERMIENLEDRRS